jgi:hypothetical protein
VKGCGPLITERQRKRRQPVAGFDVTVSVPESVNTLRAVADAGTQALIVQARSDVGGPSAG